MKKAVVVFSGGQDSTTCLVQALAHYDEVHAITFDYGQRHREEIETARRLATQFGIAAHKVMDVTLLNELAVPMPDGRRQVAERITHQEIASRAGCSREMVSRILKDLSQGGYLAVEDHHLVLTGKLPQRW